MSFETFGEIILRLTPNNHTYKINSSRNLTSSESIVALQVRTKERFSMSNAIFINCLHAIELKWNNKKVIDFDTAQIALKYMFQGDQHTIRKKEILSIIDGNISGHVLR